MPRKRSISGRSRTSSTVATNINIQLKKVNKQFKTLRSAGEYGTYASKKVISNLNSSKYFYYSRKTKSFRISKRRTMTKAEKKLYSKQFEQFLKSKLSKPRFIKKLRKETKEKIQQNLQGLTDRYVTEEDVDTFLSMTKDDDFRYFADKIEGSPVYMLVEEAKANTYTEDKFIETLEVYMTVNSEDARTKALSLYNKYVAPFITQ